MGVHPLAAPASASPPTTIEGPWLPTVMKPDPWRTTVCGPPAVHTTSEATEVTLGAGTRVRLAEADETHPAVPGLVTTTV